MKDLSVACKVLQTTC